VVVLRTCFVFAVNVPLPQKSETGIQAVHGIKGQVFVACEAGVSIKPGAQAPGSMVFKMQARVSGRQPPLRESFARSRGLRIVIMQMSWGSRPRLYAYACFAGQIEAKCSETGGEHEEP
jgi:hypothetical protein